MGRNTSGTAFFETLENRQLLSAVTTAGDSFNLGVPADSLKSAIASNGNGHFITVNAGTRPEGGANNELYATLRAADGSVLKQGLISNSANRKVGVFVDMDAADRFVVTWINPWASGSGPAVRAQIFNSQLQPLSNELAVASAGNGITVWNYSASRLAMDEQGGFVVSWGAPDKPNSPGSNAHTRYLKRIENLGAKAGKAVAMSSMQHHVIAIDMAPDGSFITAYDSLSNAGGQRSMRVQRYSATVAKVGGEITISTNSAAELYPDFHDIALIPGTGNFATVWREFDTSGVAGLYTRRFSVTGTPHGTSAHQLGANIVNRNNHWFGRVRASTDGSVLVAWAQEYRPATGISGVTDIYSYIHAQGFDAQFEPAGTAVTLAEGYERRDNNAGQYQGGSVVLPDVATLGGGQYVVDVTRGVGLFTSSPFFNLISREGHLVTIAEPAAASAIDRDASDLRNTFSATEIEDSSWVNELLV